MRIDFARTLTGLDGEPLTEADKAVTLERVAVLALTATYADESALAGAEKFKRWTLAQKITKANGEGLELTVDELAELQRLIGKGWPPLVVGPAWTLLEGKELT